MRKADNTKSSQLQCMELRVSMKEYGTVHVGLLKMGQLIWAIVGTLCTVLLVVPAIVYDASHATETSMLFAQVCSPLSADSDLGLF